MRTNYPTPSFAIRYDYQLVDSTFIHAVHFAVTKGSYNSTLGISLQSDPDTILWYILKDPDAVWRRITDPKQSPGFVYNNSIRGKQYTKQVVVEKNSWRASTSLEPGFMRQDNSWKIETKPNGSWNVAYDGKTSDNKVVVKPLSSYLTTEKPKTECMCGGKCQNHLKEKAPATVHVNPKGSGVVVNEYNGYGPLLDVCNRTSSCLGYLALGFNRVTKGLVIYYAIKNNNDVYALQTNDATLYQEWIKAESLGRYFNRSIKRLGAINVRRAAKA